MKLFKGFVFAICGLFGVITLFSLLMPSKLMTARSVTVNESQEKILAQVQDLQNWKNWHPVFIAENSMLISNPSSGAGAYAEWTSSNKKNHLEITEVTPASIKFILSRPGEKDLLNKIEMTVFKDSNLVQVDWSALTTLRGYPWEKFSGIFIDKISGPGYEAALKALKVQVEEN